VQSASFVDKLSNLQRQAQEVGPTQIIQNMMRPSPLSLAEITFVMNWADEWISVLGTDAPQLREELGEEGVYTVLDITLRIAQSLLRYANGWSDEVELEFLSGKLRVLIPHLVRGLRISAQQKKLSPL
jgi:hypothetical protein